MRVPRYLAWVLILLALFTASLLRQFHDQTPRAPFVSPAVGSMLFIGVFFILLVSAREWQVGAVPGRGVRLGSLTPLLLMLLMEKWLSLSLYIPVFYAITPVVASDAWLDASFRVFAGVGLILVCLLFTGFSRPTGRQVWRRARPRRWPYAAAATAVTIAGTYAVLWALARAIGAELRLAMPDMNRLWVWIVVGQAILAFAEELYYRGLLMSEFERLAPRLGIPGRRARRWFALLATSVLFGMEHLAYAVESGRMAKQLVFTLALGLLLGLLVQVTWNLHFAAGIHAWINWLLLGAAPVFVDAGGRSILAPGTYIGISLILAFCLAMILRKRGFGKDEKTPEW